MNAELTPEQKAEQARWLHDQLFRESRPPADAEYMTADFTQPLEKP